MKTEKTERDVMMKSSLYWLLICGAMNAAAICSVRLIATFTELPQWLAMTAGALLVAASTVPFKQAKKAHVNGH